MPELSPAAVVEAFKAASDGHYLDGEWIQDYAGQIAAALDALADQVVPENGSRRNNEIRSDILAIAAELRGESTATEIQS